MFFCSLKLDAVICTSLCRLLRVGGEPYFIVSVTRSVVVLFLGGIRAVLLLRNSSFRMSVCLRRTLCCYLELLYLLSVVDSLVTLTV